MDLRVRWAAAALGLALALTGCGGEPEPTAGQSASPSADAPAPEGIKVGREPNQPFSVTANDLGIHSYTTQPQVPTESIRLTCYPNWAVANPAPGEFQWADFDGALAQAESWGYTDILYSFCATPKWAGTPAADNDQAAFGPGTAQPPKNMKVWEEWVSAVAARYKGRITGYEIWNEPSSPQFYAGSPQQMVKMTKVAYEAIKEADPEAYVLSASTQTHNPDFYESFFPDYVTGLQRQGWPVDGIAAHFYPQGNGTPQDRMEQIDTVQRALDKAGAPEDLPLWDTEVNYNVGLPGGEPEGRVSGQRAAAWTAVTFLDSWRAGVRRPYWYLWSADYYSFPGIQMRIGDAATAALGTLGDWVIGAEFEGCDEKGAAVTCAFSREGDGEFTIAYSTGGNATLTVAGDAEVCPVYGGECQQRSGSVTFNDTPVRIKTGA